MPAFEAVVFLRQASTSCGIAQADVVSLPGRHTAAAAWREVFAALRAGGPELIGGEIRQSVQ